jgi:hypothetical protein
VNCPLTLRNEGARITRKSLMPEALAQLLTQLRTQGLATGLPAADGADSHLLGRTKQA